MSSFAMASSTRDRICLNYSDFYSNAKLENIFKILAKCAEKLWRT